MTHWPDLEAALQGRPGWRRVGREYHGPCPVSGAGRDCCAASKGQRAAVVLICRKCGGRLDNDSLRAHLDVLMGRTAGEAPPYAPISSPARQTPSPRPGAVWGATVPPEGTPGAVYLTGRGCWPAGERFPPAVRWLTVDAARRVDCRPRLPHGAAGVIVYLFQAPGEADTYAAQLEALDAHGNRIMLGAAGKRPSVTGGDFARGRRVFVAAAGNTAAGCWLCEGPLDALAVMHLARLGAFDLAGAAVLGAPGTPGYTTAAVRGYPGPVFVAADANPPGDVAAARLLVALRTTGRDGWRRRPPIDDWTDYAAELAGERAAIQDEGSERP